MPLSEVTFQNTETDENVPLCRCMSNETVWGEPLISSENEN